MHVLWVGRGFQETLVEGLNPVAIPKPLNWHWPWVAGRRSLVGIYRYSRSHASAGACMCDPTSILNYQRGPLQLELTCSW